MRLDKMTAIELFKQYMNQYWSELVHEDWLVDVITVRRSFIVHDKLKELIPEDLEQIRCVVFFSSDEQRLEVNVIQDTRGHKNLAIVCLKEGTLVHTVAAETLETTNERDAT